VNEPVSYSGTFVSWAGPLLAMVATAPRKVRQTALAIAMTAWNAVVLEDAGVTPGAVNEMLERITELPGPRQELMHEVLKALVTSKRGAFADARWTIGRCELRAGGRIFVEAREVPAPR
jgi:hypothetical protein